MKRIRVAINGFGRIGRAFFSVAKNVPELQVIAINDLGDAENLAYLLKYDTVYGRSGFDPKIKKEGSAVFMDVEGNHTRFLSEKDPTMLPWSELDIDIVLESTGVFASYEKARVHLEAGAKRVVISAPVKDEAPSGIIGVTALMGINTELLKDADISSNASCTTNAVSPVIQILHEAIGIEKAMLNTTHAYTASQSIVDGTKPKDWKEGRAAAHNIVPTTTGAAVATTKAITDLAGKFDGVAMRVPVIAGSIADITFVAKRRTSVVEVNTALKEAALTPRWKDVFSFTEEPIVSSDVLGQPFASIADLSLTQVVDGDLVKVLAWYDNEMGYTHSLIQHVKEAGRYV